MRKVSTRVEERDRLPICQLWGVGRYRRNGKAKVRHRNTFVTNLQGAGVLLNGWNFWPKA